MANEKRLIDANQIPKQHELLIGRGMTAIVPYAAIENAPTVDAVEVVHGEWFVIEDDYFDLVELKCSACGESW